MNEQIKQLADQARVLDYSTWDSYNQKTVDHYKFDKEKFAELIVKECVIRAEREWIRNGDTDHNRAISKVIESIKTHFGVEE